VSSAFPEWSPQSPYKVNTIAELNPLVLGDIRAFLEQDPPRIPIKQITGWAQFQATTGFVAADESTSSTTYGALATAGPVIDKLAPGQYLLLFGGTCRIISGTGGNCNIGPSINGATPTGANTCWIGLFSTAADNSSAMGITTNLGQEGGNTVELLYRVQALPTGSFRNRWLIAVRYA
jgi:hypothetical protein